jgi:hypothetical protein
MTITDIQLQIAEPPVEKPRSDYDPSKRVIVCTLHRGDLSYPAEACLDLCKTRVLWDINQIGTYTVQIDTMKLDRTDGLLSEECELIELWTNHGLSWMIG